MSPAGTKITLTPRRGSLRAGLALVASCSLACARPPELWTEPATGMRFVLVPSGSFEMGSEPGEAGREAQEVRHRVTISEPFYLGETEVTQAQWVAVMGSNPSAFSECGSRCPVERVSWHDVQRFLEKLGAGSGIAYRLPTEAEWEYACRAGSTGPFHTGATIGSAQANLDASTPYAGAPVGPKAASTMPVGSFAPNGWGLFDLHGNVWEWTGDEHCPYAEGEVTDPRSACTSGLKVIRGGSWYYDAFSARCALRYTHAPADSGFSLGFRVARPVD